MSFPGANGNGQNMSGIDLSALRAAHQQPDPAQWAQSAILSQAGIEAGGKATVDTANGPVGVTELGVIVIAMPPELHILGVGGKNVDTGHAVFVPWAAVLGLRPTVSL
jgi:hypothetical protein